MPEAAVHGLRFAASLALFSLLFWALPQAGRLDDGIELTTGSRTEGAPTSTVPDRASTPDDTEPDGTADGDDAPTPDGETGTSANGEGSATAPPAGESTPGSSSDGGGSQAAPADGTDPGPLADQFLAILVAALNDPTPSSIADEHTSCLRDFMVQVFPGAELEQLAGLGALGQLDQPTIDQLVTLLTGCFPTPIAIRDLLEGGGTPQSIALCMAPIVANVVDWSTLLMLEIDPENDAANASMGEAVDPAAEACF